MRQTQTRLNGNTTSQSSVRVSYRLHTVQQLERASSQVELSLSLLERERERERVVVVVEI